MENEQNVFQDGDESFIRRKPAFIIGGRFHLNHGQGRVTRLLLELWLKIYQSVHSDH